MRYHLQGHVGCLSAATVPVRGTDLHLRWPTTPLRFDQPIVRQVVRPRPPSLKRYERDSYSCPQRLGTSSESSSFCSFVLLLIPVAIALSFSRAYFFPPSGLDLRVLVHIRHMHSKIWGSATLQCFESGCIIVA